MLHARVSVGALIFLAAAVGCGNDDGRTAADAKNGIEVRAVAERYYDAFRMGRLEEACALVAARTLPSRLIVGANVRDDERPDVKPRRVASGCALVRQRRRGWQEQIPRSAWRVDAVQYDAAGERARVDTSAEGSYWMRKLDDGWRIVGFGWLTDEGLRELGGDWPAGVVDGP